MAIKQVGYLGRTGPVFIDDTIIAGKYLLLLGRSINGTVQMVAKLPRWADNLAGFYSATGLVIQDLSLGNFGDETIVGPSPAFKQPADIAFDGFDTNVDAMYNVGTLPPNVVINPPVSNNNTGQTATTGSNTGGTATTGQTAINTGTTTVINSAPNAVMESITAFLKSYWWAVVLVLLVVLWVPIVRPALLGKPKPIRKSQ